MDSKPSAELVGVTPGESGTALLVYSCCAVGGVAYERLKRSSKHKSDIG